MKPVGKIRPLIILIDNNVERA